MDPATLIGVLLAFIVVIVVNVMDGGNPMSLLILPPLLLVFGATLAVALAGGTMADAKLAARGWPTRHDARACWLSRTPSPTSTTPSWSRR